MQFGLNESQEFLRDSARKFFAGECPIAEVRRLMETDTGFDATLWAKLAEQGYTGIIFPEEYGGVGLGIVELILLMEEAGRALLPGPFFSTVVMAGSLLDNLANREQKMKYLAPICRGLTAANGKVKGEKLFVPDAAVADWIIVVAQNGVFLVDFKAPGVRVQPMLGMDLTRKLYAVRFDGVPGEKLGETAGLSRPRGIATAALAAEMVGGMQRVLDLTVEYAKTRRRENSSANPSACFRPCSTSAPTCISKRRALVPRFITRLGLSSNTPPTTTLPFPSPSFTRATPAAPWAIAEFKFTAAWASPGKTIFICITGARKLPRPPWAMRRFIVSGSLA